jgi:hypothetical protein
MQKLILNPWYDIPSELTRRFTFGDWAEEYFLQIRTIKNFSKLSGIVMSLLSRY